MKKALLSIIAATAAMFVSAAPAPYPLPINSQAQTAPPVLVYRGSECSFRVAFTDGSAASDITGCIPFLAWSTNALATGVSTSSYTIVSATNGIVDFHFDQSAVNFTAGRYLYEVGVRSNAIPRVYRQGVFTIYGSPIGAGVNAVTWSTPVNWQLIDWSNLPTLTINGVTGSIETNLSFTVTGSGGGSVTSVNGQTGTVTITASGLGALTAEADTLHTVVSRGQVASNTVAAIVTDTALNPFPGLYGTSIYGAGVDGYSVSSRGVVGKTLSGYGMQAEATGVGTGLWAYAATSGVGVYSPHAIISEANITASSFIGSGSALTGLLGTTLTDYASVTNIVLANQQFSATLWGWGSATSTVAGAYRLTNGLPTGAKQTITNAGATNNQYVAKFITATGQRFSRISQGEVTVGFNANKGAAGAATLRPEFYLLDADGVKIAEYETATASTALTTTETPYRLAIPIPSNITVSATHRIGVYLKAIVTSGTPTINVYSEDAVNFSVQVPVPSADFVTQSQLAGMITNINVNGTLGTVADGVASVTVTASSNTNKMWIPLTAVAGINIASNATAGVAVTTLGLPLYMGERKICIKRASTNLADTFTVQLTSIGYSRQTITSAVPINVSGAIITVPAFANNGNLFRAETVPGDGPPAATPSVSADIYLVPTAATLSAGAVSVWFLDE